MPAQIVQRPNQLDPITPYLADEPRVVTHVLPYWIEMAVAFTSTVNELITTYTETQGYNLLLKAAWTDLVAPRVRFAVTDTKRYWESEQLPIHAHAGQSSAVNPMMYWRKPVLLRARSSFRGDFINTAGEAAGVVEFYGKQIGSERQIQVSRSENFWLLVNLSSVTEAFTTQENWDVLIWGATTNISSGTNGAIIKDVSTTRAWSESSIPLRAMCGLEGQPQQIMWYRDPYYLARQTQLKITLDSAGASNAYVAFLAERILR